MAVSNPPTLLSVQQEFGGNGQLRQYARGGGLVPNGPAQNNNISTDPNTLQLIQFAGAVNVSVTLTNIDSQQSYYGSSGQNNTASATIQFSTDGNVYYTYGFGALLTYRYLAGGSASSFEVEVINFQGSVDTGATSGRQNLGNSPRWTCSVATRFGYVEKSASFVARIFQAGTNNLVAQGTFSIFASASDGSIG